jgi:hypothetical protein
MANEAKGGKAPSAAKVETTVEEREADFDQLWDGAVPVEETLERLRKRIDAAP